MTGEQLFTHQEYPSEPVKFPMEFTFKTNAVFHQMATYSISSSYGVSICVMIQIFRGQITRKIRDFYKEISNFLGNFNPKNSGHDAD